MRIPHKPQFSATQKSVDAKSPSGACLTRWSVNEKSGRPATPTRRGVAVASTGSATIHAHSPNNPPNNPRSARRVPCPTDTLPSAERPSSAVVIRERLMCWSVRCRAAGALHVRSCDMTVELHAALRDLATCNAMRRWACALPRDTPGTPGAEAYCHVACFKHGGPVHQVCVCVRACVRVCLCVLFFGL
jgi:hypothetical protein